MTSLRYNMTADTLPTHWAFPNIGWNEGAQVLGSTRALCILEDGEDKQDDWYSQSKYPYLYIIKHEGVSGRIEMGYKALTKGDIKEVYRIEREMAEYIVNMELQDDDDIVDNYVDVLMEEAEKIEITWVDPR